MEEKKNYREGIERILFAGFQDRQEIEYRSQVLCRLGALRVVNGEIEEDRDLSGDILDRQFACEQ